MLEKKSYLTMLFKHSIIATKNINLLFQYEFDPLKKEKLKQHEVLSI